MDSGPIFGNFHDLFQKDISSIFDCGSTKDSTKSTIPAVLFPTKAPKIFVSIIVF